MKMVYNYEKTDGQIVSETIKKYFKNFKFLLLIFLLPYFQYRRKENRKKLIISKLMNFQSSFLTQKFRVHKNENQKILIAIQNKMSPLNISAKLKHKLERGKARPTFNQFSYYQSSLESNKLKNKINKDQNDVQTTTGFSITTDQTKVDQRIQKNVKSVKTRQNQTYEEGMLNHNERMRVERLPIIMRDIESKKKQFVLNIQNNLIQFQKDTSKTNHTQQTKPYNLQYVVNRLDIQNQSLQLKNRSLHGTQNSQPLKGYQNLSPNRLKQYMQMFRKKGKRYSRSIYVSRKRIAMPGHTVEGDDGRKRSGQELQILDSLRSNKVLSKEQSKPSKNNLLSYKQTSIQQHHNINQIQRVSIKRITHKNINLLKQSQDAIEDSKQNQTDEVSEFKAKLRLKSNHKKIIGHLSVSRALKRYQCC